jgi:hypothetical protein
MQRWACGLSLAMWLLATGCAAKRPPDHRAQWIVVGDAIPNDWRICVPLYEGSPTPLRCMWVQDFRRWLRRQQQAD